MILTTGHLFCGGGGDTQGSIDAGCKPLWGIEKDAIAASVYRHRFPKTQLWQNEITELSDERIRELPYVDVIIGGSPCPDFSIAGKREGIAGTRGSLFWEFVRVLLHSQPEFFIFENVKGLLSSDNRQAFPMVLQAFNDLGYVCEWSVSNANKFVPQNRERVFVIGFKNGYHAYQYQSLPSIDPNPKPRQGLQDIIGFGNSFVCRAGDGDRIYSDIAPTLTAIGSGGTGKTKIQLADGSMVPITANICEQLMGWTLDSTKFGTDKNGNVSELGKCKRVNILGNGIVPQEISAILNKIKNIVDTL
jgi:hypothetical protein